MSTTIRPIRRCPVPNCDWKPTSNNNHNNNHKDTVLQLKQHLIHSHTDTPITEHMDEAYFQRHDMHVCLQCNQPSTIYTTQGHLRNHQQTKHTRTITNLQIVLNTYRHADDTTKTNWKAAIEFLHGLNITPPPLRRTMWHKLKQPQRKEYFVAYNNAVNWILEATPPLREDLKRETRPHPGQSDAIPFWKLILILEPLLLAPTSITGHKRPSDALRARHQLIKEGKIRDLYEAIWNPSPESTQPSHHTTANPTIWNPNPESTQPSHHTTANPGTNHHSHPTSNNATQTTTTIPPGRAAAAQRAADVGNYSTAFSRLTTHMPTATLTPQRIEKIRTDLFPPRRDPPPTTRHQGHLHRPPPPSQFMQIDSGQFELALRQMKTGTASGPFAACTDALVHMALHRTTRAPNSTRPYFSNLQQLFQLLVTAQLPPAIHPILGSNYFLALHKDTNNLERLRPIGIGTALRRLTAKVALVHVSETVRPLLIAGGQYGIQVQGGIDFVAHTTTAAVHRYIEEPQTPTRALLLLDLHNMFNNTSRTEARKILLHNEATAPLIPLFDMLTQSATSSWYFNENNASDKLMQTEGFPQGCPLSPLFSCLVLEALTNRINTEQRLRAAARLKTGNTYDDGKGGQAHTASIMDDTSICLPHEDLPWFIQRFEELGRPLGVDLNKQKTLILTTTTGTSPTDSLPAENKQCLLQALAMLDPLHPEQREITGGTRFLGQPIGSQDFAKHFINLRLQAMAAKIDLLAHLPDLQTRSHLFRYSVVPSILHLLPADLVLAHPAPQSTTTHWRSPTTAETQRLVTKFLSQVTALPTDDITTTATLIASLPNRLGGLGYNNASAAARPSMITQTARTIKLAASTETPVPGPHKHFWSDWEHSDLPWLVTYRRSIALYTHEFAPDAISNPAHFDRTTHRNLLHHTMVEHTVPALIEATPPELRPSLPSALSPLTSLALHLPRTAEAFRLDNATFSTAIKRKLRLPVLPVSLRGHKCTCPAAPKLDPEGDHFFSCAAAHKTALSNTIRDAVFDVLQHLAPQAGIVEDHRDVHIEPPGLAPQHSRNIRPADVGLLLRQPHKNEPFQYVALDVTIPPPPTRTPIPDPADHNALASAASRPHQESARSKFCRDDDTASHLLRNGIYLLPFTIDHLGSMGSFAQSFLFHQDDIPHPFSSAVPPSWPDTHFGRNQTRSKTHPAAFALYEQLPALPGNLAAKANNNTPGFSFTEAHINSIGHFARASLSHAIVSSLATHLNKQISTLRATEYNSRIQKTQRARLERMGFAPLPALYTPFSLANFFPSHHPPHQIGGPAA